MTFTDKQPKRPHPMPRDEASSTRDALVRAAPRLARETAALEWHTPSHVYNPLRYVWSGQREYLNRYGARRGRVLLLGMNPGPWGTRTMSHTKKCLHAFAARLAACGAVGDKRRLQRRFFELCPRHEPSSSRP